MARRFAQDTEVPVSRSQEEVKKRLREAGSDQIAVFEATDRSMVAFSLKARHYRITVPAPQGKDRAQEERRAWRLLLLLIKAKLEAVREGASTVEREFLADMIMPDGGTVAEHTAPQIAEAYSSGRIGATLRLEGPRYQEEAV